MHCRDYTEGKVSVQLHHGTKQHSLKGMKIKSWGRHSNKAEYLLPLMPIFKMHN